MMPDKGTEEKLKHVYSPLALSWLKVRDEMLSLNKIQIRVTEGLRTFSDQSRLYSLGRTKSPSGRWIVSSPKKVVTHARAGESCHQYGLAIDSCFMGNDPYLEGDAFKKISNLLWKEYGRLCKKNGLVWGGDWQGGKVDMPHCEMTFGLSIRDLQEIHEEGGVDEVWTRCNQITLCGRKVV